MRILFCLLFALILQANQLSDLVDEFVMQNSKIIELNKLSGEENNEKAEKNNKLHAEINGFKNRKIQILSLLPTMINQENLTNDFLQEIKKEKIAKNLKIAKLEFYEALNKIAYSLNSEEEANLRDILITAIKNIQILAIKIDSQKLISDSYLEILTYLRINIDIFSSNAIFKQLDIKNLIIIINSVFPNVINQYINPGKIIFCLLIIALVFLLKNVLLRLLFKFILRILRHEDGHINAHLLNNLRKPLIFLFYIYGIWLCLLIAFYPSPVVPMALVIYGIVKTIAITWLIITLLNSYGMLIVSKLAEKSGKKEIINLMMKIVYWIVIFIAILVILSKFGFDISAIIASLGIGGLAVALATKDIIANFFASILMLFDNSFSQGDWVIIDGTEGTIVETGLRKTAIRTFDNSLVFIPNSKIMNANIKNWSRRKLGRKIGLSIGIEYGASTQQIQNILKDIRAMLNEHPGIAHPSKDSALKSGNIKHQYKNNMVSVDDLDGYKNTLLVYLDEFAESSINIYIYCFSKTIIWSEFLDTKEDVMLKVMQIIEKHGSSFAFPSQSLYIEKMPKDA